MRHVFNARTSGAYPELFERLLEFQIAVRRLTGRTALTLSESQALGEIAAGKTVTAKEIAHACRLEKSTVSRLLAGLEERGLIDAATAADRRSVYLRLTRRGAALLSRDDKQRSAVSTRLLQALPAAKRPRFIAFFQALAHGFEIPRIPRRGGEHALRPEQRRLSRAFGLLKDSFLDSGLSSMEVHLMLQVKTSPFFLTARRLEQQLPYSLSRITRAFQGLEKRGLARRITAKDDRRHLHLSLTAQGEAALQELERRAALALTQACREMSGEQVQSGVHLLESMLARFRKEILAVTVRSLSAGAERHHARAFLVEQLVAEGRHKNLAGELLPDAEAAFSLEFNGTLAAVVGLRRDAMGVNVTNLASERELVAPAGIEHLLEAANKTLCAQSG